MEKEELKTHLRQALIDGLNILKPAIEQEEKGILPWFSKYHNEYPKMSTLDNGLPRFTTSSFEKKDYSRLLSDSKIQSPKSWEEYREYVLSSERMRKYYRLEEFSPNWRRDRPDSKEVYNKIYTFYFLVSFVESYAYRYSLEFEESNYMVLFERFYNALALEILPIDILIPIIFTTFEFDSFELTENVCIERISPEIQLSRNSRTSQNSTIHPIVIGAASHALVLKNWHIPNGNNESLSVILSDILNYNAAIEIANFFMGSLRIAIPKIETGYAQVVSVPKNWESSFELDIIETFVATERNYPTQFENFGWQNAPKKVNHQEVEKVQTCFNNLSLSTYLDLAYKRLNKACLNSRNDDAIIDIAIALESLLTSDSKSEINYRLAARAALLMKEHQFQQYTPEQIFRLCKNIYDFRSSVVHGDKKKLQKARVIKKPDEGEIEVIELAIELLKHIMWVLINHETIKQPSDIDKLLFN